MSLRPPRIAFVVSNGPQSALAERARSFAERLTPDFSTHLVATQGGGRATAAARLARALSFLRPDLCYVLDIAAAGLAAAGLIRAATGAPMVVDTGDAVVELGRALGRGPLGLLATRGLTTFAQKTAASLVVRGSFHRELLAEQGLASTFIPDGVVVDQFAPRPGDGGPRPDRPLTIGLVGYSAWSPARESCYGSDLVDLIRLLRDRRPNQPVRAVMIGDGPGIAVLRQRAAAAGLQTQIEFAGRVPYAELPERLRALDLVLSTQTNDVIGNVRTTGKLPLYLASGRFILASRVGQAARVLPPEMLVDFEGSDDPNYPARLADRVIQLLDAQTAWAPRLDCVALARAHFDYDRLAPRVAEVLHEALARHRAHRRARFS